jgi:hypothetical protein
MEIHMRADELAEVNLRGVVGELSETDTRVASDAIRTAMEGMQWERNDIASNLQRITAVLGGLGEPDAAPRASRESDADNVRSTGDSVGPSAEPTESPDDNAGSSEASREFRASGGVTAADAESPVADSVPDSAWAPAAEALPSAAEDSISESAGMEARDGPAVAVPPTPVDEVPATGEPSRERPYAANVASNTPITLRPSGETSGAKTLKCSDCGSWNLPTDWYCERCGAELAAF